MRQAVIAILIVLGVAGGGLAAPIVDYFNYGATGGVMNNRGTAGDGWAGGWSGGSIYYQPATNLTYTATGYSSADNLASTGSVGNGSGGATQYASVRSLSTRLTGTFWISALVSSSGGAALLYLDRPDTAGTNDTRVGLNGGKATVRFYGGDTTPTKTYASGTHLLLAKLTVNTGNDTLDFWVDPDLSGGEAGLPTADISKSGADAFGNDFSGVGVASTNPGGLDAIRIGTFNEVVGVPEPATLGLVALGGLLMAFRRRHA